MYLPPRITEILHEERVKSLQQSYVGSTRRPLYLRLWTWLRQVVRREEQWVHLPLEGETQKLLHTLRESENVKVTKPRYQRGDLA